MKRLLPFLALALVLAFAGTATAADQSAADTLGAFPGCYSISTGTPGAPTLHVSLIFSTNDQAVNGHAQVTKALQDPVVLRSKVRGSYLQLLIRTVPYFVVNGTGYPDIHWPPGAGIGPVILPNLEFHFNTGATFTIGGETGKIPAKGKFRYRTELAGPWTEWFEGSVQNVNCFEGN